MIVVSHSPGGWFQLARLHRLFLACALCCLCIPLAAQNLLITEFMAGNATGQQDEDKEFSDWIEIYNAGTSAASLEGWHLTDDANDLAKWTFPARTIAAREFLLVYASGKNRTNATAPLHTNFKLDVEGEFLALTRPDGSIAAQFAPAYPRQRADVAYGVSMAQEFDQYIAPQAAARVYAAAGGLPAGWTGLSFDDSSWRPVVLGAGYDRIPPGERDPAEPAQNLGDVTVPGDFVVATSGNSPGNEGVENAIDNTSSTKYLNFDKLNAGLTITPAAGPTVVSGLRLTSANDAPERDPTSFVIYGSNDGAAFVEVARNVIPTFSGRFTTMQVTFNNQTAYRQYRLIFPTVRSASTAVAMQIAEIEFLGVIGPTAPSLAPLISTSIESEVYGKVPSAALRVPFLISQWRQWENLALHLYYDDGVAAWLNGTKILTRNAPQSLAPDAFAPTNRFRRDVVQELRVSLGALTNLLQPGTNILALQGWNDRLDSADFLLGAQLDETRTTVGAASYFQSPTPGRENSTPSPGIVSDLVSDRQHGFYEAPFDLTLFCPTPETTIRYTTNGSPPNLTNSVLFTGPIRIRGTTVLRAAGFREGWLPSRVLTSSFLFLDDILLQTRASTLAAGFPSTWNGQAVDYGLDPRVVGPNDTFGGKYARSIKSDLQSLPAISIVMNVADMFGPQGIYSNPNNRGAAWERPLSIELILPDRKGFQKDAGVRIQGGAFRRFDLSLKKSFRIVFRERYGEASLDYPLFGAEAVDEFQNFVLRANSNDAWPYFGASVLYARDAFAMESQRLMGKVASHSRFVHLYINGFYWGLYNPVERPDAAFSASYYGGDRSTWDALNQDSAPDGNYDAWNRLLALLGQDVSRTDIYQRIQGNNPDGTRNPAYEDLLDVEALIDYIILNIYVGNTDWPHRNWWAGRDRNNGDGFKFYPWDTETALGVTSVDANVIGANTAVARPYAALRANADFRLHFADRVHKHFFNGGVFYVNSNSPAWNPDQPQNNQPAARFFRLATGIRAAIVGESARWGDQLRSSPFTRDEHWQPALNNLLANYFPRRSAIVLEQLRVAGLYPRIVAPILNQHGGEFSRGFQLTMSTAAGKIYYTTNGADPRGQVGVLAYNGPIPLTNATFIKSRTLLNNQWSALSEAEFYPGRGRLAVTELHFRPAPPSAEEIAAGFADANDFEFIELGNLGNAELTLTGLKFTSGITFDFTNSLVQTLGPGQYLLLVRNKAGFQHRYGTNAPVAGVYSGRLDNSGERLALSDQDGDPLIDFTYGAVAPWPEPPLENDLSIEPVNPLADLSDPANWQPGPATGGTPGQSTPPRLSIIYLNAEELWFSVEVKAGQSYSVQVTGSLSPAAWQTVDRIAPVNSNQSVQLKIPRPANAPMRFIRVAMP